ncbi:hypothetical protein ES708_12870 [subsurface metagenome]
MFFRENSLKRVRNMPLVFLRKLRCFIGDHCWTCKAEQGINPTPLEIKMGVEGFKSYSTMFCERCGEVPPLFYRIWRQKDHE